MAYEPFSMEQLLNISKFFYNSTIQEIINNKETVESLSLEELKKNMF